MGDPRDAAAQYHLERLRREEARAPDEVADASGSDDANRTPTAADRAAYVEVVIQQAIRRGDFDDLPGAGWATRTTPTGGSGGRSRPSS